MKITETSIAQRPLENLETIETKRLAVLIKYEDKYLLEVNTKPGYDRITTFLNTTLTKTDETFSEVQIIEKAKELIKVRTGYTDVSFQKVLPGTIERTFHKPDGEFNEKGIYDHSIVVFELLSENKVEVETQVQREIVRLTAQEIASTLDRTGKNGSSHLIRDLYQSI